MTPQSTTPNKPLCKDAWAVPPSPLMLKHGNDYHTCSVCGKKCDALVDTPNKEDCYCFCHSPVSSRAHCYHCEGHNLVELAHKEDDLQKKLEEVLMFVCHTGSMAQAGKTIDPSMFTEQAREIRDAIKSHTTSQLKAQLDRLLATGKILSPTIVPGIPKRELYIAESAIRKEREQL